MSLETIINYSIGIVGTLLAIYGLILQVRSNRKKEPVYSIKSYNLISDYSSEYQKLRVSYNRKKVENLTVSKVLFYNRGAETISQEDISTKSRPRILAKDGIKILDASILQTNNPSSEFAIPETPLFHTALKEGREALIWFTYLDKNQGVVYQIIHTGISSEDVQVVGDIRGVKKITQIVPTRNTSSYQAIDKLFGHKSAPKVMGTVGVFLFLLLLLISIYAIFFPELYKQFNERISRPPFFIVIFLFIIPFVYFGMLLMRSTVAIAPKGLEKFDE